MRVGRQRVVLGRAVGVALVAAARYQQQLREKDLDIPFQSQVFDSNHARHLLVGRFDPAKIGMSRDELLLALRAKNIGASIHYRPLHLQPLYHVVGSKKLAATEVLAEQIMTLPISARMTLDDVDYVVDHLSTLIRKLKAAE